VLPLQALTSQNGEALAHSILSMSERHTCHNPDKFIGALKEMFAALDPERVRTQTGEVLQDMIEQLRQHEVGGVCVCRRGRGAGGRGERGDSWVGGGL